MSAAVSNVRAVVKKWSKREKKLALAVLLREFANGDAAKPIVIKSESNQAMGLFFLTECTIEDLDINADTPEMRELKRRAEAREDSISHEEMIALMHQVDAKQGLK